MRVAALLAFLSIPHCLIEAIPTASSRDKVVPLLHQVSSSTEKRAPMQQSALANLAQKAARRSQEGAAFRSQSSSKDVNDQGEKEPTRGGPKLGFWKSGAPKNPALTGHMLTPHELDKMTSIQCLEAKQRDPTVKCSNKELVPGPLSGVNAGNYPFHGDDDCHSRGEYFCDPDRLLSASQHTQLANLMKTLREKHKVTCGPQSQHDPVDMWNYAPFYLGVAIAQGWPMHESDEASLDAFGKILLGRWNMSFMWHGSAPSYSRCPLSAMLIILPDQNQAHLSSSSCMFICPEKGGPEVSMSALVELGQGGNGVWAAVERSVRKVYEVIDKTSPEHVLPWVPNELTSGTWKSWEWVGKTPRPRPWADVSMEGEIWNWAQRILFIIACLLLLASLCTAVLVCYLAPGVAKQVNSGIV